MTRPCSNNRFFSIPSAPITASSGVRAAPAGFGLLLLLTLGLYIPGLKAEIPLRAFTATYELQVGSISPGTVELSLEPVDDIWRWRLDTHATGIYAMFIRKQPYSETRFRQTGDDPLLQSILITDDKDAERREYASFDWELGKMQVLRKGKNRERALTGAVYDYQSIHLLAADMQLRQQQSRELLFYRKGKLIDARLDYVGEEWVEIDGKQIRARCYRHTAAVYSNELRYYYDADNPLLPVLIERHEEDESPTVLKLQKVDWRS